MSDAFDAAFGAAVKSTDVQEDIPAVELGAQSEVQQASSINLRNAALAAIQDNRAVQEQYANNADLIAIETAKRNNTTAINVAAMAEQSIAAVKSGREGLQSESLKAIEEQKQLSQLQADKPNAFAHPLRWMADTLHESKLEDSIQQRAEAVQTYSTNINNVVTSASVQMNEVLAMQNLTNTSAMQLRAAEINQGIGAAGVVAASETDSVAAVRLSSNEIYNASKTAADWEANRQLRAQQAEQLRLQGKMYELDRQKRQDALEEAKLGKLAEENAAHFYRLANNIGNTPAEIAASKIYMRDLRTTDNASFQAWNAAGGNTATITGRDAALSAVAQTGTVTQLRVLGSKVGDTGWANLGADQINAEAAGFVQALKTNSFNAAKKAKPNLLQAEWENGLTAAQRTQFSNQALKLAQDSVGSKGASSYIAGKVQAGTASQAGVSLAGFNNVQSLQQLYKLTPAAAKALAAPEARIALKALGTVGTADITTNQAVKMMEILTAAKVPNAVAEVGKILQKEGDSSFLNNDPEAKLLIKYGVVPPSSHNLVYKGKSYSVDSPEQLYRMYQVAKGLVKPSVLEFVGGKVAGVASEGWRIGATENPVFGGVRTSAELVGAGVTALSNARDSEWMGVKSPTEAAQAASKFTPAGQAPIAGGLPSTATLTEADRAYSTVATQIEAKNVRAYTLQNQADTEAAVAYDQASASIDAKNARAHTNQLMDSVAAEAAYSQAAGQIDAKNARAYTDKLFAEVSAAGVSSPADNTKALKSMQAAIQDGTVTPAQAKPVIKAKVQEAKDADKPKAASAWDSLLDLITPAPQQTPEGGLRLDLSK